MQHKPAIAIAFLLLLGACASSPDSPRSGRAASTADASAAELHIKLGQGYMEQGEYEVALERLTRAIQLDPNSADAHTVIAVLYERIGRRERAETHYRRAVALKPEAGMMNNNYGTFLCHSGRFDESIAYFSKAIDDPFYRTPEAALANAGSCSRKAGRSEQAERFYREALAKAPRDAGVLLELADMKFETGEFMRARAFMQRYIALGSPTAEALGLAVLIERGLGDVASASAYLDTLRRAFPDSELIAKLQDQDPS